MTSKCFLDMDGVIADFVGAACRAHNRPNPYRPCLPKAQGEFDMAAVWGITHRDFWKPVVAKSLQFWTDLEKTPEADAIVEFVCEWFGAENVAILTAPSSDSGSIPGKRAWIARHYPQFSRRVIFSAAETKSFLSAPGKVLIDDRNENVGMFHNGGGAGVLVPRPWNTRHWQEDRCLESIQRQVQRFAGYARNAKAVA